MSKKLSVLSKSTQSKEKQKPKMQKAPKRGLVVTLYPAKLQYDDWGIRIYPPSMAELMANAIKRRRYELVKNVMRNNGLYNWVQYSMPLRVKHGA